MTHGRPLGYDPDQVLNAAMQVFWQKGYEATSLQDLLSAMGLSKSSFYQAFSGKKELFIRCMSRYSENVGERLGKRLEEAESGRKFIENFLLLAAGEAGSTDQKRGCLLINTASELAQKDPEIAGRISSGFGGLKSIFAAAVRRGQQEGEVSTEVDAEALAEYLLTCTAGIKTAVKGGADHGALRAVVEVMMRAL